LLPHETLLLFVSLLLATAERALAAEAASSESSELLRDRIALLR